MEKKRGIIGGIAFMAGLLFIAIGVMNGEHLVVMQKAVTICLECIGIG